MGPILFILFVNDLVEVVNFSTVKLYADDCKLYLTFPKRGNPDSLATDLQAVDDWARVWQLSIAYHKCFVMHIGYHNPNESYFLGQDELPAVSHMKDLGVTFSDNLKFSEHTNLVSRKGFLFEQFDFSKFLNT